MDAEALKKLKDTVERMPNEQLAQVFGTICAEISNRNGYAGLQAYFRAIERGQVIVDAVESWLPNRG